MVELMNRESTSPKIVSLDENCPSSLIVVFYQNGLVLHSKIMLALIAMIDRKKGHNVKAE